MNDERKKTENLFIFSELIFQGSLFEPPYDSRFRRYLTEKQCINYMKYIRKWCEAFFKWFDPHDSEDGFRTGCRNVSH